MHAPLAEFVVDLFLLALSVACLSALVSASPTNRLGLRPFFGQPCASCLSLWIGLLAGVVAAWASGDPRWLSTGPMAWMIASTAYRPSPLV